MKQIKRSFLPTFSLFSVVFVMLMLVACGGSTPDASDVEVVADIEPDALLDDGSTADTEEAVADTELPTEIPVATVPPATEAPLPTATSIPTEIPEPTAVPTADPLLGAPADLWIGYGSGDYGLPVLMKKGNQIVQEPLPPLLEMELFFDYSPEHGLMAFGGKFWEGAGPNSNSVTDLWVYDFKTDQLSRWFDGGVGRAAWSSDPSQPPTLAVALHNGEGFDLVVAQGPDAIVSAADNISSTSFAWAPGQGRIAFIQDGTWQVVNPFTRAAQRTQLTEFDVTQGWTGDAPIWDLATDTLILADQPLTLAPIGGGAPITVSNEVDGPFGPTRPTTMLWSPETRQLVAQVGEFVWEIKVFTISSDLTQIEEVASLLDHELTMWFVEGESIVVLDADQEPQVWSLIDYEFVK